jgi:hypothetical protein
LQFTGFFNSEDIQQSQLRLFYHPIPEYTSKWKSAGGLFGFTEGGFVLFPVGEVLPKRLHIGERCEGRVTRDEHEVFYEGLGGKGAIKRVSMLPL